MILHAPLPVAGSVIGRTDITGLVDKGPGRGALLLSERNVIDKASKALLATRTSTTFLRGYGGFCGASSPTAAVHKIPDCAPDLSLDLPILPQAALIYRLSGDDNPLHADPKVAAAASFPRPILHGLCTYAVACRALLKLVAGGDPSRMKSMGRGFRRRCSQARPSASTYGATGPRCRSAARWWSAASRCSTTGGPKSQPDGARRGRRPHPSASDVHHHPHDGVLSVNFSRCRAKARRVHPSGRSVCSLAVSMIRLQRAAKSGSRTGAGPRPCANQGGSAHHPAPAQRHRRKGRCGGSRDKVRGQGVPALSGDRSQPRPPASGWRRCRPEARWYW